MTDNKLYRNFAIKKFNIVFEIFKNIKMDNQIILSADGQQSEKSVIIYRSEDGTIQLEVQLHEETVWLTQAQMAILFETTRNNITIHIGNLFREGELDKISVCKHSLLTASDGKPYKKDLQP